MRQWKRLTRKQSVGLIYIIHYTCVYIHMSQEHIKYKNSI